MQAYSMHSVICRAAAASRPLVRLGALFVGIAALLSARIFAAETGVISGSISNAQTSNMLEGALVEIPQLKLTVLTDNTGRFVLSNIPVGTHQIVASYIGLDTIKAEINVSAGQRAIRDFELTSVIYKLEAFKVTGEREGNAAM